MILTTQMILHLQIGHHAWVKMKYPTHTHSPKQRIGINTDFDPIVVIGLYLRIIGVTMGGMLMIVAIEAPLTRPAHQVTEVGKVRGIKAKMIIGHPDTTHTPCEHVGVQERGQCPLIPLHIMSGTMKTTLMKTNTRQNFCVVIKVLSMTE